MNRLLELAESAGYEPVIDQAVRSPDSGTISSVNLLNLTLDIAEQEKDLADKINAMLVDQAEIDDNIVAEKYCDALKNVRAMIESALVNRDNLFDKLEKPLPAHYIGIPDASREFVGFIPNTWLDYNAIYLKR